MSLQIGNFLERSRRLFRDHPALCDDRRTLTHGDFGHLVDLLAGRLVALGVSPGDRVAILSLNRVEYIGLYFAIAAVRAVAVPLNDRLHASELAHILVDSTASVIICEQGLAAGVEPVRELLPHATFVDLDAARSGWTPLLEGPVGLVRAQPREDDVVVQMYTSGTTGVPKGAMLTQRAVFLNILCWMREMPLTPKASRYLQVMPLFHIGGFAMGVCNIASGSTEILQPRFEPDRVAHALASDGITHLLLVPSTLRWLLIDPAFRDSATPHLQRFLYGGSPIEPAFLREAMARLRCDFVQGYGLTETMAALTVLRPADHTTHRTELLMSAGQELLGTQVRVVDDDGTQLDPGELGEVVARGTSITCGYWGMADATAEALRDGWFHTGDLGRFDEAGYLTLVDRKKDMVIVGGENVYPSEVEAVLSAHPAVTECAIIGVPHPVWGEAVMAVVVTPEATSVRLERQLIGACRTELATFKCPTRVIFVPALPRNAVGKVRKHALRDEHWQGRDRRV